MKLADVELKVEPNLATEKVHRAALSESGWIKMNDKNKAAVIADYINHEGSDHCAYVIDGDFIFWSQITIDDPVDSHEAKRIGLRKFFKERSDIVETAQREAAEEIEAANANDD